MGTSLVVPWLRLRASTAGGMHLTPCWELRFRMPNCVAKNRNFLKIRKKEYTITYLPFLLFRFLPFFFFTFYNQFYKTIILHNLFVYFCISIESSPQSGLLGVKVDDMNTETKSNHTSHLKSVLPSHILTSHWTKASYLIVLHSAHHSAMARREEGRLLVNTYNLT